MHVIVSRFVLGSSLRSRTRVLQCVEHMPFGDNNNALLDAGAYLDGRALEGRSLGLDVLVRPLEVAWIEGTRVAQSWSIELQETRP